MIKEYIKGDIRDTHIRVIGHGVNCDNKMGSGVAKALLDKWPQVKSEYHSIFPIPKFKLLGRFQEVECGDKLVLNIFTQEVCGYDGAKYVSYRAIANAFDEIARQGYKEIAIPKIGCGLAGGDWNIVETLINESTGDKLDVYVYEL